MASLKHCKNLLRCQLLTSSVRSAVNHFLESGIWRCIRRINIPKLRLTHWINPLQLSKLSLWIYMCNKELVNRKRIVRLVRNRNALKTVVEETSASLTQKSSRNKHDLLDNLSSSRNKWQKVVDAKEVSKSLVVKCNKARNSISSEFAKNKKKTNAGSAREARRRRQMVGERARNSEKYPLASKLLITECKLRRAKGSKISKLWLTTKMKQKIESCYGKEEASKFKASKNWFQRFKRRYNISLRKSTNKKKCCH